MCTLRIHVGINWQLGVNHWLYLTTSTCVALHWLAPFLGVMWVKKVEDVLSWWVCVVVLLSFNNFSLHLLIFSKNSPRYQWSLYFITLHNGPKPCLSGNDISLLSHKKQYNDRHSVIQILLPNDTIGKFSLQELHISISNYEKRFTIALSHYTIHRIDIYL